MKYVKQTHPSFCITCLSCCRHGDARSCGYAGAVYAAVGTAHAAGLSRRSTERAAGNSFVPEWHN